MIRLHPPPLTPPTAQLLMALQQDVDALATYEERVTAAKKAWDGKASTSAKKAAFQEIKGALTDMLWGQRCHYCEDSCADEIEHMRPKDLYPDQVFCWDNYAYSCGPCNGPKNNQFAVLDANGSLLEVSRKRGASVVPPSPGTYALLDPRMEDPLDALWLDLDGTFLFSEIDQDLYLSLDKQDASRRERARYTIQVLRLNRPTLVRMRQRAFDDYKAHMQIYNMAQNFKQLGMDMEEELQGAMRCLKTGVHRTVWEEIKRQREVLGDSTLKDLLRQCPEVLSW